MERQLGLSSLIGAGAVVVLAAQPAGAVATEVTDVRVNQAGGGIEVVLATRSGDRPQIFTVSRGNTLVADIINTRLSLRDGNGLLQNSPAPGISSVVVSQLDANSVRVAVTGDGNAPAGQVRQGRDNIVLGFTSDNNQVAQATPAPTAPLQAQTPAPAPAPTPASPAAPTPDVLVPNPQVVIDGVPVLQPTPGFVPPLLPRAIAPPVGDIAVSTADPTPEAIDLGTGELVPRLVLREAPVRDVLSLLARAAGLNVAYIGELPGAEAGATQGGAQPGQVAQDVTISLDIENEPIQNVFNYVLRISGLEANLVGRTVFVGPRLPNDARNLVVRTLRLNQVNVAGALNFLVGLGAETAVSRERPVTFVTAVPTTGGEGIGVAAPITQTQTTTEQRLETQRVEFVDSTPLLRGLQVIGDERTNSVTLIGTPRRVELATSQLAQLDIRRRQVAVNVKVIDVNLLALNRGSTSFSFGVGDTSIVNTAGIGVINFGNLAPATVPLTSQGGLGSVVGNNAPGLFDFTNSFLAQLQLAVTNGNAKILTDPTLVVQEGQTAQVQLTQEVVTNFEIETTGTGNDRTQTVTVETTPAGLILQVQVDRIDDNGFVSLSVAPSISAPTTNFAANVQGSQLNLTLLAERTLTSGQVRVRDGQTLILSGIIQESDRTTVTKVPILGDIPLLGALFRNTERENSRQEVIILLTPQVIDDSDASAFGYRYIPGRQAQQVLQQQR